MRRTALALFVIEPTHLRCGKLDLIQAKSKFRREASVGGFCAADASRASSNSSHGVCQRVQATAPSPPQRSSGHRHVGRSETLPRSQMVQSPCWVRARALR